MFKVCNGFVSFLLSASEGSCLGKPGSSQANEPKLSKRAIKRASDFFILSNICFVCFGMYVRIGLTIKLSKSAI